LTTRKDISSFGFLTARPIAHRGLHDVQGGVVENTESAFSAAIAARYAIECDLQITREGEAVVFHDESLERLTLARGEVRDLTVQELKAVAFRNSPDRIQTFREFLEQVGGTVPLVIELKTHWDGDERLVRRAIDLLRAYRRPHVLMSFDPDIVAAIARLSPSTVRGIVAERAFDPYYEKLPLSRRQELRNFSHIGRSKPDFVSFYFEDLPWAPITALRSAGMPIVTWTIRSPEEAQAALRHSDQITFEGFLP
jgi:glycerophosphoryl diester phosphodiesterase